MPIVSNTSNPQTLTITTDISASYQTLTAIISDPLDDNDIPKSIFMYENTGSGLGSYQGVCTLKEYQRMQEYTGTNIPLFGNKFIRYNQAVLNLPLDRSITEAKDLLIFNVKSFKDQFLASKSITTIVTL